MERYDDIVVGSGISGLTLALLLGLNRRKVLLIEKSPAIGGSLQRFYKQGVPFDTGFHFTGGFGPQGTLSNMLKVLGIEKDIEPVYLSHPGANKIVLEQEHKVYELPFGCEATKVRFKEYFPADQEAIERYFSKVDTVCRQTLAMDIRNLALTPDPLPEDFVTLQSVLDELTDNRALKALLSAYDMCYGSAPQEVSFAAHARVCYSLHEALARVKDGGEAFIRAFKKHFRSLDITVKCGTTINAPGGAVNSQIHEFTLSRGEQVYAENVIFTIHPRQILEFLPREELTRAFIDRVRSFENSMGFFSLFGVIEDPAPEDLLPTIVSLFPQNDLNRLLVRTQGKERAMVIMKSREEQAGKTFCAVSLLELSFFEDVARWQNSRVNDRPQEYLVYKNMRKEEVLRRFYEVYPQYRGRLRIMDVSSQLTFRDYLNSPDGCAYGIRQKAGQFNLFGKLPIRNFYAAGQSAVLPGIVGAMLSSFIVARSLLGKDEFTRFIEQHLEKK